MDLTQILKSANAGDEDARHELLRVAYAEMKRTAAAKMRGQRLDHTLGASGLVNEVVVNLLRESRIPVENGTQFFAYAARAMRNLLIDHARSKGRQKRGGEGKQFAFDEATLACETQSEPFLELNHALDELAEIRPRHAQVVELRYFGGMSNQEVADALGTSVATVKRDWLVAKSWLLCELAGELDP